MLKVIKLTAKEECVDEFKELVTQHTLFCKTEPGALVSDVYQDANDPTAFYIFSEFESEELEAQHSAGDADKIFMSKTQPREAAPGQLTELIKLA